MPVRHDHLDELLQIMREFVVGSKLKKLLLRLQHSEAYVRNSSFRITVDRLIEGEEKCTTQPKQKQR